MLLKINLILQCIAVYLLRLSDAIIVENRNNKPALDSGAYTPLQSNYDHDPEATVAMAPRFAAQAPVQASARGPVQAPVHTQVRAPVQPAAAQGFFYPRGIVTKSSDAGDSNVIVHVIDAQGNDIKKLQFPENVNELLSTLNRMSTQNYPGNSFQVENVPLHSYQVTNFPTQGFSTNTVPNFNVHRFPSGGVQSYTWNSGYQRQSWTGPDGITRYKTITW